jgi:RNA polymerase sigma factor (TIGR02999 family)
VSSTPDVTTILQAVSRGDERAADQLLPLVYAELRRLAQSYLAAERPGHTLQATALVHEAYLRLVDQTRVEWRSRGHFFAVGAQAMRRVLVDSARARGRDRRGADWQRISLDAAAEIAGAPGDTGVIELDEAIQRLAEIHPEKARIVELRYFGGLTAEEVGGVTGVSLSTVERSWRYARAWLYRELRGSETTDPGA